MELSDLIGRLLDAEFRYNRGSPVLVQAGREKIPICGVDVSEFGEIILELAYKPEKENPRGRS